MPRINPEKFVFLLYKLHTMSQTAWELSKNPDLTSILEEQRELLEKMIKTIEDGFVSAES